MGTQKDNEGPVEGSSLLSKFGLTKEFSEAEEGSESDSVDDDLYTLNMFMRDALIGVSILLTLLLLLFLYTGKYPPLVVIESGSMQHDDESSSLGVIDQGDLVLIKSVDSQDDIRTWQDGKETDYKTYGDYGDVIIYFKNGDTSGTPIIHRAIVLIEFNTTGKVGDDTVYYFDVPQWGLYHVDQIRYNINQRGEDVLIHYDPQPNKGSNSYGPYGFDGYITKGDNNYGPDQGLGGLTYFNRKGEKLMVKHVYVKWVDGKARGEIPWYGLLKLKISNNEHNEEAPQNSWTNIWLSSGALVAAIAILGGLEYRRDLQFREKAHKEEEEQKLAEKEKKRKKKSKKKNKLGKKSPPDDESEPDRELDKEPDKEPDKELDSEPDKELDSEPDKELDSEPDRELEKEQTDFRIDALFPDSDEKQKDKKEP